MIYLIGGAPRIGKSIIAQRLSAIVGAVIISTDDLPEPPNNLPPLSFHGNPAENILTPDERVDLQIAKSDVLRPTIARIVDEALQKKNNSIIEGIHLLPKYVYSFIQQHGVENIKAVFVGSTDIELVLKGMAQNTNPNDWLKDANEVVRRQVAEFTVAFSRYLIGETNKLQLVNIERSNNFEMDVNCIIGKLVS